MNNQEKIENNKIKSLQNKVIILEKIIYTMQEQLKIERDVIDCLEKSIKLHTVELTVIALCLVYLLLK